MKVKEFEKLFPEEYKQIIFDKQEKIPEKELAHNLFIAVNNGEIAKLITQDKYKAKYSSVAKFVEYFFEKLAANATSECQEKKISARLLKKAKGAVEQIKPLIGAEVIENIATYIQLGKEVDKKRKDDKEAVEKAANPLALAAPLRTYPAENCLLSNLKKRATELRADNFKEAKKLSFEIESHTKKHPTLELFKKINMTFPEADFNCTTVKGVQHFLFAACPKTAKHAALLFDKVLAEKGSLLVTTIENWEGKKHFNNFWTEANLQEVSKEMDWRMEHKGSRVIATGENPGHRIPKLHETTIEASKDGITRTVTHLHYDGWIDHMQAPDERVLMSMLLRMRELSADTQAPIAVNCHGGVGRTGTTGLCTEIFREIDARVAAGESLDTISVNIPETLAAMRLKGRYIMSQYTTLAQTYAMVGAYYELLQTKALIQDEVSAKPADKALIAEQAVS